MIEGSRKRYRPRPGLVARFRAWLMFKSVRDYDRAEVGTIDYRRARP